MTHLCLFTRSHGDCDSLDGSDTQKAKRELHDRKDGSRGTECRELARGASLRSKVLQLQDETNEQMELVSLCGAMPKREQRYLP